jgi:hypothetical protein
VCSTVLLRDAKVGTKDIFKPLTFALHFFYSDWFKTRRCIIITAFQLALECVIGKVRENQVGLKLNGTHYLLGYTDDVNLLGQYIDTLNSNTNTLIDLKVGGVHPVVL